MDINDFDSLSAEEYDKKRAKERKEYLDRKPVYSKLEMFAFVSYVFRKYPNAYTIDLNKAYAAWKKTITQ